MKPIGARRSTLLIVLNCLLLHCDAAPPPDATSAAKMNVLLITLDTVRADALGAYGQERPTSPRLDAMAREGVLFEEVVTAAPHTLASHASIMTGRYPFAHGARANHGFQLSLENETLAEILTEAGYLARAEISAPVLHAGTRISQGFEASPHPESAQNGPATPHSPSPQTEGLRRSAENITARGLEVIDAATSAAAPPFFLWLHYFDAHLPYLERAEDLDRFPDAPYLAQIAALDRSIGQLLDRLEERGLRERTLVVVTSDHGEGLGEHSEPTHSYFVYDSTMRVPLIMWGPPALSPGTRASQLVQTVDIFPTVLEALGRRPKELDGLNGRSLWGLASGDKETEFDLKTVAYGESLDLYRLFGTTPLRLIREGKWKYIHSAQPELYDLASDPRETTNVISRHPEIAGRLLRELVALVSEEEISSAANTLEMSAAMRAELQALGYVAPASPTAPLDREMALLEITGPPPADLAVHAETLSRAKGVVAAKRFEAAIGMLEPVASAHPRSAMVLSMLGEAQAGAGRRDEALTSFERAVAVNLDPCAEVALDRSRALGRFKNFKSQVAVLREAVEACPESATYLNEAAWVLATVSDPGLRDSALALEFAERLLETSSGEPDPNHLDTLATALAADGAPTAALDTQVRAIDILERNGAPTKIIEAYRATAERYRQQAQRAPSLEH